MANGWQQEKCSDQTKFFGHLPELVQGEVDLLLGVSRHQADADELVAGQDTWRNDRVDEHPFFLKAFAQLKRRHKSANINGQNRSLRVTQIESEADEALLHALGITPQLG